MQCMLKHNNQMAHYPLQLASFSTLDTFRYYIQGKSVGNRKNRTVCNFCWSGSSLQFFFKNNDNFLSLSSELKSAET